jgi:putative membrane protein
MKTKLYLSIALVALGLSSVAIAADALSREDKEFLKNAGELNMTEIALGKLAQDHAFSPEVKTLGATLLADHTAMTTDLVALAKLKGVEMDVKSTGAQKSMIEAFKGKTGAEFDREFREHVAKDHEKGIRLFEDAAKDSKDPDVKAYAVKNLAAVQGHHAAVGGR